MKKYRFLIYIICIFFLLILVRELYYYSCFKKLNDLNKNMEEKISSVFIIKANVEWNRFLYITIPDGCDSHITFTNKKGDYSYYINIRFTPTTAKKNFKLWKKWDYDARGFNLSCDMGDECLVFDFDKQKSMAKGKGKDFKLDAFLAFRKNSVLVSMHCSKFMDPKLNKKMMEELMLIANVFDNKL